MACRGHRSPHRGARASARRGDLHPPWRAVLPHRRAQRAGGAAAAAPCDRRHRRRHVRRSRQPRGDARRRGGGGARRAARARHRARARRRPASTGLGPPTDGTALRPPRRGVQPGPHPHRRQPSHRRDRRAHPGVDRVLKYLVISDIHANIEALEAVLAAAGRYDHALVLGDLVGYGADPNAVIDRVRSLGPTTFIRGNHDKVGSGLESTDGFNYLARHAIEWTANSLTDEHREWLAALPQGPVVVDNLVEIFHGTPFDEDVYLVDDLDALRE